jgi:hypothetical protein
MSEGGGAPPGTIKSRLYAARRSLSKLLHAHVRADDVPETRERSVPTGVPPPRFKEERP